MSELKTTPGPWRVGPPSGSGQPDSVKQYNGKPFQEHSRVEAGEPPCVKSVVHVYQGSAPLGSPEAVGEQLANARLIAASPDLLEELTALVNWIEEFALPAMGDETEGGNALIASAELAIKKATE